MTNTKSQIAVNYYNALNKGDIKTLATYLHPQVLLISPLSKITGKDAVCVAAQDFSSFFHRLIIKESFENEECAVIVYDLECPLPVGLIRTAVLMTFKEGVIVQIELFFNPEPFKITT